MKASDLLKKTTITPDDDPRSKLQDEEEDFKDDYDEDLESEEDEKEIKKDAEAKEAKQELAPDEEQEIRGHQTFEDEELDTDDETPEPDTEKVEPKHTFKRSSDGGPTPKYHNIAGFSAVSSDDRMESESQNISESDEPEDSRSTDMQINRKADQGETLDDLAEEDLVEEPQQAVNRQPVSEYEEESMDIPNLKSQQMPSSGIYTSHNGSQREFSTFNPPPRRGKSKNLLLQLVVLAVIALAVIGGTVYALKKQFKGVETAAPSPSLEAALPSPTPSPSPEIKIDRSKYKIRVLNGTSTSGLAASVSAKLKELGYQTDKTGNATNSAFTQTQVKAKNNLPDLIKILISDLKYKFDAVSSSAALTASDSADAEIIIGSK